MDAIVGDEFDSPSITVLIAARPTLFRLGLTGILKDHHPDWHLVEIDTCAAAEQRLQDSLPDVVLLDENLPGFGGVEGLRHMRVRLQASKILILADGDERDQVLDFIDAGAHGYITKSAAPSQVLAAFRAILCGGVFAPASLTQSQQGPGPRAPFVPPPGAAAMTDRQRDVFDLMAQGYSTKMIARELGLAVGTVKVHLAAIYRLLGAHNRTEAVAKIAGSPTASGAGSARDHDLSNLLGNLGWST